MDETVAGEAELMYRAFQGANGWYVAAEGKDGFHRQPADQSMTRREAELEARRRNDDGDDGEEEGE